MVIYKVKAGDTLFKIGREHGVSWKLIYLMNMNIIRDPNLIYPDMDIKIPTWEMKSLNLWKKYKERRR